MTEATPIIGPDRTYVLAMTPGDDGVEIEFDAPGGTLAEVQRLIDESQFPEYRSVDDFARDALVHYMTTKLGDIQDREQRLKAEAMLQDIARREDALRVLDGYATDESVKGKIS
jgi:hypothetical protein